MLGWDWNALIGHISRMGCLKDISIKKTVFQLFTLTTVLLNPITAGTIWQLYLVPWLKLFYTNNVEVIIQYILVVI